MTYRKPLALIIEDEPFWSSVLERLLAPIGVVSRIAPDAAHARRLLHEDTFDVILIDVVLPGQEGLVLLEEVGRDSELASRCVIVTAHPHVGSYFAGEIPIIDKAHPANLIPMVRRILERGNFATSPDPTPMAFSQVAPPQPPSAPSPPSREGEGPRKERQSQ